MKTADELLVDAPRITSKIIKLQEIIAELELYSDINWLKDIGYILNQEPTKIQSEVILALVYFLESNVKASTAQTFSNLDKA